jgi:hypothetical protein
MFYMSINVCFAGEFQYILKIIISHFVFFIRRFRGLIWVLLEVMLGSVWASWLSWSRLGVILGRPDAFLTCSNFVSSDPKTKTSVDPPPPPKCIFRLPFEPFRILYDFVFIY